MLMSYRFVVILQVLSILAGFGVAQGANNLWKDGSRAYCLWTDPSVQLTPEQQALLAQQTQQAQQGQDQSINPHIPVCFSPPQAAKVRDLITTVVLSIRINPAMNRCTSSHSGCRRQKSQWSEYDRAGQFIDTVERDKGGILVC